MTTRKFGVWSESVMVYGLTEETEKLPAQATIELTDEEYADYLRVFTEDDKWAKRLRKAIEG